MKKNVYIADIDSLDTGGGSQGHYVQVFRDYSAILVRRFNVFVAGGGVFAQYFSEKNYVRLPRNTYRQSSRFVNKLRNLVNLKRLFEIAGKDTIIFQSSAMPMVYLGILLWSKKETRIFIIHYSALHGGGGALSSRLLYRLIKRRITGNICTSDNTGRLLCKPYVVVPDYIYTNIANTCARDRFEYDFAIVGIINHSKGTLEAVRALARSKATLVVAGRCLDACLDAEIRAIAANAANIDYRPGYIDERELKRLFRVSRYAILNYAADYSEHSSGIVFDALFNGCPLVARRVKSLAFVEEMGLGYAYDDIASVDFCALLGEEKIAQCEKNISEYLAENAKAADRLLEFIDNPEEENL